MTDDDEEPCGSVHTNGGQVCERYKGHTGPCRCWGAPNPIDESRTYSEWHSENGKFKYHIGYKTIYLKNPS